MYSKNCLSSVAASTDNVLSFRVTQSIILRWLSALTARCLRNLILEMMMPSRRAAELTKSKGLYELIFHGYIVLVLINNRFSAFWLASKCSHNYRVYNDRHSAPSIFFHCVLLMRRNNLDITLNDIIFHGKPEYYYKKEMLFHFSKSNELNARVRARAKHKCKMAAPNTFESLRKRCSRGPRAFVVVMWRSLLSPLENRLNFESSERGRSSRSVSSRPVCFSKRVCLTQVPCVSVVFPLAEVFL